MGAGRSRDARGHAWVARPQALARAREPEPQGPRPRAPRAPLLSTGAVSACSLAEEVVRKRPWARQEAAAPAARLRLEAPSVSVAVVSPRPAASRHVWPMRRAREGPSGRRRSAGRGAGRRTCRVAHAADASAAQLLVHGGSFYVEFPSFHRFRASSGFMCGRIQEKRSRLLNREGDETLWAVGAPAACARLAVARADLRGGGCGRCAFFWAASRHRTFRLSSFARRLF